MDNSLKTLDNYPLIESCARNTATRWPMSIGSAGERKPWHLPSPAPTRNCARLATVGAAAAARSWELKVSSVMPDDAGMTMRPPRDAEKIP